MLERRRSPSRSCLHASACTQEDPQRGKSKSANVQSVKRWVPQKSFQLEETAFHFSTFRNWRFVRAFVISFKRCRIPRDCRVCLATASVKHKSADRPSHG